MPGPVAHIQTDTVVVPGLKPSERTTVAPGQDVRFVLCSKLNFDVYYTGEGFLRQDYDFFPGSRYSSVMTLNKASISTMSSITSEVRASRPSDGSTVANVKEAILPKADRNLVEDTFFGGIVFDMLKDDKGLDTMFFINIYRIDGKLRPSVSILEAPRKDKDFRTAVAKVISTNEEAGDSPSSLAASAAARCLLVIQNALFTKPSAHTRAAHHAVMTTANLKAAAGTASELPVTAATTQSLRKRAAVVESDSEKEFEPSKKKQRKSAAKLSAKEEAAKRASSDC